jgi:hypothetical protein
MNPEILTECEKGYDQPLTVMLILPGKPYRYQFFTTFCIIPVGGVEAADITPLSLA